VFGKTGITEKINETILIHKKDILPLFHSYEIVKSQFYKIKRDLIAKKEDLTVNIKFFSTISI
jgi:hypothetical protein